MLCATMIAFFSDMHASTAGVLNHWRIPPWGGMEGLQGGNGRPGKSNIKYVKY